MEMTRHASRRSTQRSLPMAILETIHAYGQTQPSRGAVSIVLDGRSIDLAVDDGRHTRPELERYRGVYMILGDSERVVTVARRRRCFRRNP